MIVNLEIGLMSGDDPAMAPLRQGR